MIEKKIFYAVHDAARYNIGEYALKVPHGWSCTFAPPKKTRLQEEKYHAMIADISKQVKHLDRYWDQDDMKRILVDEFAHEMRIAGTPLHHDSRLTISLDGQRTVQLGIQTREFRISEAAQFIEYLECFGAQNNVVWKESNKVPSWVDCRNEK